MWWRQDVGTKIARTARTIMVGALPPFLSSFLTSSRPSSLPSILLLPSFLLLLPDLPLPFLFHPSRQSATAADVGAMFPRTSTTMA